MYVRHMHGKGSEFYVAYRLTILGYNVTFPHGTPRYDLIAESQKGRLFIQVKSTEEVDGLIKVNLRGNCDTTGYSAKDIDVFAIHERKSGDIYYIHISELEGKTSVCLRESPPPKLKTHRTRLAKDYIKLNEEWFKV